MKILGKSMTIKASQSESLVVVLSRGDVSLSDTGIAKAIRQLVRSDSDDLFIKEYFGSDIKEAEDYYIDRLNSLSSSVVKCAAKYKNLIAFFLEFKLEGSKISVQLVSEHLLTKPMMEVPKSFLSDLRRLLKLSNLTPEIHESHIRSAYYFKINALIFEDYIEGAPLTELDNMLYR